MRSDSLLSDSLLPVNLSDVPADGTLLTARHHGNVTNAAALGQPRGHLAFDRGDLHGSRHRIRIDPWPALRVDHQHEGGELPGTESHLAYACRHEVERQTRRPAGTSHRHRFPNGLAVQHGQSAREQLLETLVVHSLAASVFATNAPRGPRNCFLATECLATGLIRDILLTQITAGYGRISSESRRGPQA